MQKSESEANLGILAWGGCLAQTINEGIITSSVDVFWKKGHFDLCLCLVLLPLTLVGIFLHIITTNNTQMFSGRA